MNKLDTKTVKYMLNSLIKDINRWLSFASRNIDNWDRNKVNYSAYRVSYYLYLASEDARIMHVINEGDIFPDSRVPSYKNLVNDLTNFFVFNIDGVLFNGSDKENKAKAKKLVKKAEVIIMSNTKTASHAH